MDKQVKINENITQEQIDDIKNFNFKGFDPIIELEYVQNEIDTELEFAQNEIRHENLKFLSEEDKSKNQLQ